MSILSGFFKTKKYRKTDNGYKLQSEWTSSNTVEMDDGQVLQDKLTWKYMQESFTTGKDKASIPTNAEEVFIKINVDLFAR